MAIGNHPQALSELQQSVRAPSLKWMAYLKGVAKVIKIELDVHVHVHSSGFALTPIGEATGIDEFSRTRKSF
jgi:hypothetical protein